MSSATDYQPKDLGYENDALDGISEKTIATHHDKLYVGYVNKMKEIATRLKDMTQSGDGLDKANQTYSELRGLRRGETFATNGVFLHECYFDVMGGNGEATGSLVEAIKEKWGSLETFQRMMNATGMAMRGWAILAWDTNLGRLKIYAGDAHNQGGVWGCIPLIAIDLYEHSYFMDYGSDRKAYLEAFWKNMNWEAASKTYDKAKEIDFS